MTKGTYHQTHTKAEIVAAKRRRALRTPADETASFGHDVEKTWHPKRRGREVTEDELRAELERLGWEYLGYVDRGDAGTVHVARYKGDHSRWMPMPVRSAAWRNPGEVPGSNPETVANEAAAMNRLRRAIAEKIMSGAPM